MIFVTVGSSQYPFDRLLRAVSELGCDERLVVQTGPSIAYSGCGETHAFMTFAELSDFVKEARVVITHAGVGSIILAATQGHTPIVVPRLARLGEVVDDHQVEIATELAESGRVVVVGEGDSLRASLKMVPSRRPKTSESASALAQEVAGVARQAFAQNARSSRWWSARRAGLPPAEHTGRSREDGR